MNGCRLFALLLALTPSLPARAQGQINLALVADGDSRFYELFAGSWTQIVNPKYGGLDPAYAEPDPETGQGQPFEDGYFSINDEPGYESYNSVTFDPAPFKPTVYQRTGDGSPNAFPNERHFQADYNIIYDASQLTGVGRESAPILSADLDFYPDFAHGDMLGIDGYVTNGEVVQGVVHFINGQVSAYDATIDCKFVYDMSFWGFPAVTDYSATLTLDDRRWTLVGDGFHYSSLDPGNTSPLRNVWDGHGYLDDLYESGLPGDYDNGGQVDGNDLLKWQRHVGDPHHALPNDPHADDPANVAEYVYDWALHRISSPQLATWRSHFGQSLPGVISVPEPSAAFLALLALVRFASRARTTRTTPRPRS